MLIAGPTASGKSALAIAVARALDGEVVNADSMQVYNGLSVLSARPTIAEMAGVPHHLFGVVDPRRAYSVGDYLRDAATVLADIRTRGRKAVIVGGTGLYFRALTEGLVETPPVSMEVRARLESEAWSGVALHARLAQVDPAAAARLSQADRARIVRALEVFETTGRTLAEWQATGQGTALLPAGRWKGLFLNRERPALFRRIDARFLAMMEDGALDEVRSLMALKLPPNRGIMKAHGVPHLMGFLAGDMSREAAVALGQGDTRRYAKRQVTWARKFMADWEWLDDPAGWQRTNLPLSGTEAHKRR